MTQHWSDYLRKAVEEVMGGPAQDSCRHCGTLLWLVKDERGSGKNTVWVSYHGMGPSPEGNAVITSRFCPRVMFPQGRRQHAPIPTSRKKLDAWLDS